MFRLQGLSAGIRGTSPPILTDGFALVTELGGVAFLVVFLSVVYWVDDREATGTVIGYALVALAVTLALKSGFALSRPPASVRAIPVEPGSYGFPSGHAIAATVVYGGLLVTRDRLSDLWVAVPTALLIVVIGLSRVVVGVHYLGDVIVGHAVGLVVLAGLRWGVGGRPDRACLIAAGVAVLTVGTTGASLDSLLALGGSLGGAVAFRVVDTDSLSQPAGRVEAAVLVAVGLPIAGVLYWLSSRAGFAPVAVAGNALLVAVVVVLPAAFEGRRLAASAR